MITGYHMLPLLDTEQKFLCTYTLCVQLDLTLLAIIRSSDTSRTGCPRAKALNWHT